LHLAEDLLHTDSSVNALLSSSYFWLLAARMIPIAASTGNVHPNSTDGTFQDAVLKKPMVVQGAS